MDMVHNLVRNPSIVLEDVIILNALRYRNLLCYGQNFGELVIGYIVQFCAVVLGYDQLQCNKLTIRPTFSPAVLNVEV